MADKEFVNGLIVKAPNENAPDFVKCDISIKRVDLIEWLSSKSDDWININIKESKGGKLYAEVNNWKPTSGANNAPSSPSSNNEYEEDDDDGDF